MFFQYSADLLFRPQLAFRALLEERKPVRYGLFGVLVLALVYFIGISIPLSAGAMHLPQPPVINIPPEQYYSYQRFMNFPAGLAGTILSAGVIRLAARGLKGQGRFEDLFALLGFSLVEVAVVMGLPDLLLGVLAAFRVSVPAWLIFSGPHIWLGTLWCLLLYILAVQETERVGWKGGILLGLLGFAVNGMVMFIFHG